MAQMIYELSFKGSASDAIRAVLHDCEVIRSHGVTIVRAHFPEQATLHDALARSEDLGLELVEVHLVAEAEDGDITSWG